MGMEEEEAGRSSAAVGNRLLRVLASEVRVPSISTHGRKIDESELEKYHDGRGGEYLTVVSSPTPRKVVYAASLDAQRETTLCPNELPEGVSQLRGTMLLFYAASDGSC